MAEYLPEDQDLIDELAAIDDMSTGEALAKRERKISEIQIRAILRSRKTAVDVEKSTSKFSIILMAFAVVQILIAMGQLVYDFLDDYFSWASIAVAVLLLIGVVGTLRKADKALES